MNDLELFHFHLERAIYILKFQDRKLAGCWVHQLNLSLDTEYIESFLTAAIFELSVTDTETFHWTLDNLSDWKSYANLLQAVTRFALQKLINKGFIPGQDFSFTSEGKILLHENAKNAIIADVTESDNLLIKKILLIPQELYSITTSCLPIR